MTRLRRMVAIGVLLAAAGCSRNDPPPPQEEETTEAPSFAEPTPALPPEPEAAPPVEPRVQAPPAEINAVEEVIEPPIDESEQTLDDAAAVGMTTRSERNVEDDQPPANAD
ncbi:MAG: hypothetical protein JWN59_1018 [Sphingomonas bacterium]|jgi:hypothetical protein|nr:hypothetical protein [Sphingomonas bacterium]